MGNVILTMKLLPDSAERDVDAWKEPLREKLKDKAEVLKMDKEPIAYGLNCLKIILVVPDKEGVMPEVEEIIQNIEGVNDVSVIDMSRTIE